MFCVTSQISYQFRDLHKGSDYVKGNTNEMLSCNGNTFVIEKSRDIYRMFEIKLANVIPSSAFEFN